MPNTTIYYITLHRTALVCTALHTKLFCTALYCNALLYADLGVHFNPQQFSAWPLCKLVHCNALFTVYSLPQWNEMASTPYDCTVLYCTVLYCTVLCQAACHWTTFVFLVLNHCIAPMLLSKLATANSSKLQDYVVDIWEQHQSTHRCWTNLF